MDIKKILFSTATLVSLGTAVNVMDTTAHAESVQVNHQEEQLAKHAGFTVKQFKAIKVLDDKDIDYTTNKQVVNTVRASLSDKQQAVVKEAQKQVGIKFAWGGSNPQTGFDCSGLVKYVYQTAANISLGNTVNSQATAGKAVSQNDLQPGDIVFFNNNSYNGIYIGNGNVIATIGTEKVGIANMKYLGTFSGARRVLTGDTNNVSKATELDNTYVTITTKNGTLWGNTDLTKKKGTTANYYQKTFKAERYYTINGVKYYSLYNNDDKWIGYLAADGVQMADNQGGIYLKDGRYATVAKGDYTFWKNLKFDAKKGNTDDFKGQVVRVKGYYNHFNGAVYASLYNKDNKWLGYVNQHALSYLENGLGEYHSYKKM